MKIIFILKRMDKMIRSQATGKPEEFASRLGVSERTMYNYLALLKGLGAPLRFSRVCDSYLYLEDCKLLMEYDKMLAG